MTRDDTRAQGTKEHKETNYERYFSTPEKAAEMLCTDGVRYEFCKFDNCEKTIQSAYQATILKEMCEKCALEWLMRPAEPQ